jgi:hypothetical protein
VRLQAEHPAHPAGVTARPKDRNRICSGEKSTRPERRNTCATVPLSICGIPTVGRPASRAAWLSRITPSPATLIVPVAGPIAASRKASRPSSSWMNCSRASKPSTVGITGRLK